MAKENLTWPPTEVDDDVMMLHDAGHAPSEIDEVLEFEPGTAHDIIVNLWRLDKKGKRRLRTDYSKRLARKHVMLTFEDKE